MRAMSEPKPPTGCPPYVRRSPKCNASRFARIDNELLQKEALSFRARGLLAYILSKPQDWTHSAERLANKVEGKHAIRAALRELETFGFARLDKERGAGGQLINRWFFSEAPASIAPDTEKPHPAPDTVLPGAGQPDSGQPDSGAPGSGGTALFETTVGQTTVGQTTVFNLATADAVAGKAVKTRKPRARNPLIDTLASLNGSDPKQITGTAWSGIAKCLAEIKEVCPGVTPDEIRRRAVNYRLHYPDAALTPYAMVIHWALADKSPGGRTTEPVRLGSNLTGTVQFEGRVAERLP
jgi:hypothetical protein